MTYKLVISIPLQNSDSVAVQALTIIGDMRIESSVRFAERYNTIQSNPLETVQVALVQDGDRGAKNFLLPPTPNGHMQNRKAKLAEVIELINQINSGGQG